jgi:hypothetical protein
MVQNNKSCMCYCVYNLYCLLVGREQIKVEFVPSTIWRPFRGQIKIMKKKINEKILKVQGLVLF